MANLLDEFGLREAPAQASAQSTPAKKPNLLDEFDLRAGQEQAPKQNTSLMGDLGTDIKRGVQQLPGVLTGLADIGAAGLTGRRYVDDVADQLGEATGFQPDKWQEEARQEYSPARQQGTAEIDQAWEDGSAMDVAGAYARNPGNVAGMVAESLPQMLAGGVLGRGALVGARATGLIANPATVGQAARQAVVAGAGGEGAVIAGGTMDQIDREVDPRRAAAAATGAGVIGGVLSGFGARLAQRAGLIDVESALAGGVSQVAGQAPGLGRRVAGGALTEGVLEELPQSIQEQMLQNWAEQKPLMEGVPRAAVEGTLAGSAIGGAVNVARRPSEQMGIDPAAGPLSSAAATAVDGTATPVRDATRAALLNGAPEQSAGARYQPIDQQMAIAQELFPTDLDAEGNLHFYRYDRDLQVMVEVPEAQALAAAREQLAQTERMGFDPQDTRGLDELVPQVEELPAQPPLATVTSDSGPQAIEQINQPLPLATVEMDTGPQPVEQVQGVPTADDPGYELRLQKNGRPFRGQNDVRLRKLFTDLEAAGESPVVVQHEGGWAVAVPRQPVEPPAPLGLPAPSTMVVDSQGNAQRGAVAPFVEPGAQVRPIGGPGMERQALPRRESGRSQIQEVQRADNRAGAVDERAASDLPVAPASADNVAGVPVVAERPAAAGGQAGSGRPDLPAAVQGADGQRALNDQPAAEPPAQEQAGLPEILAMPRKRYIDRQAKAAGIKKGSPGYDAAVGRLESEYERQVDDAQAALPFEQFNALNKESPEGVNRQAWTQLRKERGIETAEEPAAPKAKSVRGADIDGDWASFSKDSGTLNIPRAEMPQIKAEHRGAMVNFLNARGVAHAEDTIAADQLKPTQAEYSTKKVEAAKAFEGGDRSILISSDGHVLDGHHQWLAKRDAGADVKVIRLDAPIRQLLETVAEFPSATNDDATAENVPTYSRQSYRQGQAVQQGARAVQLRMQLARLTGGWQNAPKVKVVQSVKDLPDAQRRQVERDGAFDVEGMFADGQVYLVADNLRDVKHAAFVLQHEVLGHAGLQGAYGQRLTPLLMSLYNGNAELKAQADALVQRYGYKPSVAMEEVLADMAGAGTIQQQPFWQRLVTAMRNALRSIGVGVNWNESDIQGLLANARGYIVNGRRRPGVRDAFSRDGRSGQGIEISDEQGRLLAPNGKRSRLNQRQWHQARSSNFKSWFGNWQGLAVGERLAAMAAVKLQIPEGWRNLSIAELRKRAREALSDIVKSGEPLVNDELGEVLLSRNKGVSKFISESADPAKLLMAADMRSAFRRAVHASSRAPREPLAEPNIQSYERLLAKVSLDGSELVAVFTVQRMKDGKLHFYNAVFADDQANNGQKETPAVSPRDTPISGELATSAYAGVPVSVGSLRDTPISGERATSASTEIAAFSRRALERVNPDNVSKVTDGNGEPLVIYHGTAEQFTVFDQARAGQSTGHATAPLGIFLTSDKGMATAYAEKATDGMPGLANVMPLFGSIKKPYRMSMAESQAMDTPEKAAAVRQQLEREGYDGIQLNGSPVWVAFYNNQVKSATNNTGAFDQVDPDIRYRRSGQDSAAFDQLADRPTTSQSAEWQSPSASQWDDLVYKLQDKHIDTKRALEAIRATGKAISDDLDVYLQEELYHGRAAKRTEDFAKQELEPLMQYLNSAGLKIQDVEEYLHARHAPEANRVIAERNPKLQDGGSGMTNAEASAVLASYTGLRRKQLEVAAAKVDAIIAGTRQTFVSYGLESQATVDGWSKTFASYVPLMREQEADGGMAGLGTGQGFSVKGREVKGRTGSTRKVVDILANIAMQRERAIVRGEKNRVAAALVGLAQSNPSDLWQVDVVPTQQVLDKDGQVKTQVDSLYKQRDNVVVAKVANADGTISERAVVFNDDDPRALRMAAALKSLDAAQLEGLLGATAKVTRYLAAVNTQYNPIFGLTNLARDVQGAALNLSSTELAGKQREVLGLSASALRGIYAVRRGKKGGGEWGPLWEDFQQAGGQTGYRDQYRSSADRGQALEQALDPSAWAETKWGQFFTAGGRLKVPMEQARKAMAPVFTWLDDYNTAIENGVRLAAYKVALDSGVSKARAASLAKNLTTNFNRKGQSAQQVGALYAFFNASVQGTARIGDTLFDMEPGKPKTLRLSSVGKKIVVGGVMLGAMQALLLAAAGFDDDEPPEFIRERNIIIPLGGKRYATIPLPLGFHVLPNMGRIPMEFALSGFDKPADRVLSLMNLFSDTFNPIGNAGLSMQTIAPTVLDPLAALAENKDFSGRAIAKESFNRLTPGHALARDTATAPALWLAEGINALTGGTQHVRGAISPTPDQIDYLIGQVTGGVGRELSKLQQSVVGAAQGDDVPAHKVPVLGRFYGDADSPSAKQSAFYNTLDDVRRHAEQVKGLRLEGKTQEANAYANENREVRFILAANAAEREVRKLRKRRRELEQSGASRALIRAIDDRMTQRMERFNELVKQ